jgi:hypothetical protein
MNTSPVGSPSTTQRKLVEQQVPLSDRKPSGDDIPVNGKGTLPPVTVSSVASATLDERRADGATLEQKQVSGSVTSGDA